MMFYGGPAVFAVLAVLGLGASTGNARIASHAPTKLRAASVSTDSPLARRPGAAAALSPFKLLKLGEECKCPFVEACSCGAAVAFLDCVSSACASGACHCPSHEYALSCAPMGKACPSLSIDCSTDRATCSKPPKKSAGGSNVTSCRDSAVCDALLEELEALRAKKCMLIEAGKDGWLRENRRLQVTYAIIWEKSAKLEAFGGAAPDMSCHATTARREDGRTGQPEISWNRTRTEDPKPRTHQQVRASVIPGFSVGIAIPHEYYLLLLFSGFMTLVFATLYSWHRHQQLVEEGKGPYCGVLSTLCCLCCTPATICWPIDVGKP